MKKPILFILLISFSGFCISRETFANNGIVTLKPSLEIQMKRQEAVNNKNALAERLAKKKAEREEKKSMTNTKKTLVKSAIIEKITPTLSIPPVPSLSPQRASSASQIPTRVSGSSIPGVDMQKVYTTWIGWYNQTRRELGLNSYIYDTRLHATAHDWNMVFAEGRGQNHHKRNPGDSYYDYKKITAWFAERGVVGKVVGGATTTENVGYGYYNCNSSDCTDTLIRSIRSTFDYYMSEKSYNGLHYKSIVQPSFRKIGLDIIIVPSEKRYYLTVHYITE